MFPFENKNVSVLGEYQIVFESGVIIPAIDPKKIGFLRMQLTLNEFIFFIKKDKINQNNENLKPWFSTMFCIPHEKIVSFDIKEPESVSIMQAIRGKPKTIITIEYMGKNDSLCFFKCEMASFISPYKNHAECENLVHIMKANGIFDKFQKSNSTASSVGNDILKQIEKLAELHKSRALTDEEFNRKKAELLERL